MERKMQNSDLCFLVMVFILVKLKGQNLCIPLNSYTIYDILYQSTNIVYIIDMKTPHPGTPDALCPLLLFFSRTTR